jgi:DNA-binding transcriptional MerR regulator
MAKKISAVPRVVIETAAAAAASDEATPRYRSGAVARMIQMPVSTLRVWERRYRVAQPHTSPSGHRLYSAIDVRRLAQLKQLTDTGHAIGSIAALNDEELRQVSSTHATTLTLRTPQPQPRSDPWRVLVVGEAFARRLQRKALMQRVGRPIEIVAVYAELSHIEGAGGVPPSDALLLHLPRVDAATLNRIQAAVATCGVRQCAMLYGYGAMAVCDALAEAGVQVLREAQDDRALAVWLRHLADIVSSGDSLAELPPAPALMAAQSIAPRRYDDAALTDFASLSSTIACECPRHVAELLMQLSHFEAYSADCEHRSPADASLHAYLKRVAGTARALFESALERVAIQEGLMLPR